MGSRKLGAYRPVLQILESRRVLSSAVELSEQAESGDGTLPSRWTPKAPTSGDVQLNYRGQIGNIVPISDISSGGYDSSDEWDIEADYLTTQNVTLQIPDLSPNYTVTIQSARTTLSAIADGVIVGSDRFEFKHGGTLTLANAFAAKGPFLPQTFDIRVSIEYNLLPTSKLEPTPYTISAEIHSRHIESIQFGNIQAIEFYKPATSSESDWSSPDYKQGAADVYFRGDDVKLRLTLDKAVSDIIYVGQMLQIAVIQDNYLNASWVPVELDEDDRLSPDRREIWVTLGLTEQVSLGLVAPSDLDDVLEYAYIDWVAGAGSNFNDSDAAASALERKGYTERGRTSVWNELTDFKLEYIRQRVISGGWKPIMARAGAVASESRDIQDQADFLYLSTHGHHDTGKIFEVVSPEDVKWGPEMDVVVIAGCSVLDVNNYNNNVFLRGTGRESPGERWARTGVRLLLGYNWTAPLDDNAGMSDYTGRIISRTLESTNRDLAVSWMQANRSAARTTKRERAKPTALPYSPFKYPLQRGWNASAIVMTGKKSYLFWNYNVLTRGKPTLTSVSGSRW